MFQKLVRTSNYEHWVLQSPELRLYRQYLFLTGGSACRFRLRRKAGDRWERVSLRLEPRSAYLLREPSRTEWEHCIPEAVRYSLTFRTLRKR